MWRELIIGGGGGGGGGGEVRKEGQSSVSGVDADDVDAFQLPAGDGVSLDARRGGDPGEEEDWRAARMACCSTSVRKVLSVRGGFRGGGFFFSAGPLALSPPAPVSVWLEDEAEAATVWASGRGWCGGGTKRGASRENSVTCVLFRRIGWGDVIFGPSVLHAASTAAAAATSLGFGGGGGAFRLGMMCSTLPSRG